MGSEFVGTIPFQAPEIVKGSSYDCSKADIFSFGVTLFFMITGNLPFSTAKPSDYHFRLILAGRWDLFWKLHSRSYDEKLLFFGDDFMEVIQAMLDPNPQHRATIQEL